MDLTDIRKEIDLALAHLAELISQEAEQVRLNKAIQSKLDLKDKDITQREKQLGEQTKLQTSESARLTKLNDDIVKGNVIYTQLETKRTELLRATGVFEQRTKDLDKRQVDLDTREKSVIGLEQRMKELDHRETMVSRDAEANKLLRETLEQDKAWLKGEKERLQRIAMQHS